MLDQHKAHARIHRQMVKQMAKSLQPARRCPDPDDGKSPLVSFEVGEGRTLLFAPAYCCARFCLRARFAARLFYLLGRTVFFHSNDPSLVWTLPAPGDSLGVTPYDPHTFARLTQGRFRAIRSQSP